MIFDVKKLFDSAYKKNGSLIIILTCAAFFFLFHIVISSGHKYIKILESIQGGIIDHSSRIGSIEKMMIAQDMIRDEEFHDQMEINNIESSKIGYLEGRISMLADLLESRKKVNREVDYE